MNFTGHHWLLTMSIIIFLLLSAQHAARPSKENRESIKQMVIDWYRRTSLRRKNYDSNLHLDRDKVTPIVTPISEIVNELTHPMGFYEMDNEWGKNKRPVRTFLDVIFCI